jgi:hypothetical protein
MEACEHGDDMSFAGFFSHLIQISAELTLPSRMRFAFWRNAMSHSSLKTSTKVFLIFISPSGMTM